MRKKIQDIPKTSPSMNLRSMHHSMRFLRASIRRKEKLKNHFHG
jgi:hypothetical protein